MKSLPKIGNGAASRGFRFLQQTALGGVLLASLLSSFKASGQGNYYPVTNPGIANSPNFTYVGIAVNSDPNLQFLQNALHTFYPSANPPYTLEVPVPSGKQAVPAAVYQDIVQKCIQGVITASPGTIPPGITLKSLAVEAVNWNQAAAATTAGNIAKGIFTASPADSATALSNLNFVLTTTGGVKGLAAAQPTLIASMMPSILDAAAGKGQGPGAVDGVNNWGANVSTAQGIGSIVVGAINEIPRNTADIANIVSSALSSINYSLLPAFNPATSPAYSPSDPTTFTKESAFVATTGTTVGLVPAVLTATSAYNNVPVIQQVLATVTNAYGLSFVPAANGFSPLDQILGAAYTALNTAATNNSASVTKQQIGALAVGAFTTQGGSATAIGTRLGNLSASTKPYTDAMVNGYLTITTKKDPNNPATTFATALAAYQFAVTHNPANADAVASAVVPTKLLVVGDVVHYALANETGDPYGAGNAPNPASPPVGPAGETHSADIVAAVMGAYLTTGTSIVTGAIDTTNHVPWGKANLGTTFGDLAWASGDAMPITSIGSCIQAIVTASGASSTTLDTNTVTSIVNLAIQGAKVGSNTGAFADIVYKAQAASKNTAAISGPLVVQAVNSITAAGTGNPYIAVVAAAAGDGGTHFSTIKTAGTGALSAPTDVTAANDGLDVVNNIQGNQYSAFTSSLAGFVTAQTVAPNRDSTKSTIADLYGSILTFPNGVDADLALAIKQSTVADSTLTTEAMNALHVSTATNDANLNMIDTVVSHIKNEATNPSTNGIINDMVDFIGHQIVTAPKLVLDIAIAATVINPDDAHFVAHAVAFNAPTTVSTVVGSIFAYAQITQRNATTPVYAAPTPTNASGVLPLLVAAGGTKSFPGTKGTIIDQPAAAAAITAGLTTGIIEANLDPTVSDPNAAHPNTQAALIATINQAVIASVTENQVTLRGPAAGKAFNAGDTTAGFKQSNGTSFGSSTTPTYGAAGAITGYMAEVTVLNQTTITPVTMAVLAAAVSNAKQYGLYIAQAAGQAFAWVSGGGSPLSTTIGGAGTPIYDIAHALTSTAENTYATEAQLQFAVQFGFDQANKGVIGAGALGLNATGLNPGSGTLSVKDTGNTNANFYLHRSAQGTPVTDIFNL